VTGGAGFLGKHLVEQLLASGKYEIAVFDIRNAGDARVTSIVGDLRKPEQVQAAVAGAHESLFLPGRQRSTGPMLRGLLSRT
jgi:nucleoside-diphosphate-sugar epimerase